MNNKAKTRRRRWKDLFRYVKENARKESAEAAGDEFYNTPVSWNSVGKFWQFVRPHRRLVLALFAFSLLNQAMSVVMPVAIGRILDSVLPQRDTALLTQTAIIVACFLVLRSVFLYCERYL